MTIKRAVIKLVKVALTVLALGAVAVPAGALSGGPIFGQVVDGSTGKPIPDAIVGVHWHGSWTRIVLESSSTCYHVQTARTDANGRYQIAAWREPWSLRDLRFTAEGESFNAYKPGYRLEKIDAATKTLYMAPYRGPAASYFEQVLSGPRWNCSGAGASNRNLYRVFRAMAEEAEALARTPEQRSQAGRLRERADESLINFDKPNHITESGRMENIDPRDRARMEEVPQ